MVAVGNGRTTISENAEVASKQEPFLTTTL